MSQLEKQIGEKIQEITDIKRGKQFVIMSGKVVAGSLDEDEMTVDVVLSINDETSPTEGVMLNGVSTNNNGMIQYPADGSDVWVALIDGKGKYGIIKCSNLVQYALMIGGSKIFVKGDEIDFNGGTLGGLPILKKIADNLNTLKKYIKETLEPAIKDGITAVGIGGAANGTTGATAFNAEVSGAVITFVDMENTKIKQ